MKIGKTTSHLQLHNAVI